MIIITKYARNKLLKILSDNLHISSRYGPPPIFYWYRNVIVESKNIKNCRYLRRGNYKYCLGQTLGVAHVKCDYIGRKRVLIITDYDINTKVLFSWGNRHDNSGLIPKDKKNYQSKSYRKLTTKPLFGYTYVMNNKKEYNLIDKNGKLITQWFRNIQPLSKPYGKYQIIAYININGYLYALGYNGNTYNMNTTWNDAYLNECISILLKEKLRNTQQFINESKGDLIRINKRQLYSIIKEIIQDLVA